jgi:hypothetical protein
MTPLTKAYLIVTILASIVINIHLYIGFTAPELINQFGYFNQALYGPILFAGWGVLMVFGIIGVCIFKQKMLKVYSMVMLLAGLFWVVAILNTIWYKI